MTAAVDKFWNDAWEVACPPSVPLELWNCVPDEYRREFLIEAALGLRRGFHPIDTFEELLEEKGIRPNWSGKSAAAKTEAAAISAARPMPFRKFGPTFGPTIGNGEKTATTISNSDQNARVAAKLWPSAIPSFSPNPRSTENLRTGGSRKGLALRKDKQIIVDDIGDTF